MFPDKALPLPFRAGFQYLQQQFLCFSLFAVSYTHLDVYKRQGLIYTDFALSNLRLSSAVLRGDMTITVCVDVTNTGAVAGAEVMQVYVGFNGEDTVGRPLRELKGFDKVFLQPGESKSVSIPLDRRAFSYYETRIQDCLVYTSRCV